VIPEEMLNGPFDSASYRPSDDAIEKYIKSLRVNGQCRGCNGSCAIDWSSDGFVNPTPFPVNVVLHLISPRYH